MGPELFQTADGPGLATDTRVGDGDDLLVGKADDHNGMRNLDIPSPILDKARVTVGDLLGQLERNDRRQRVRPTHQFQDDKRFYSDPVAFRGQQG